MTEVFAPRSLPGCPRGRPPDIRPQNLLFGLLFRSWDFRWFSTVFGQFWSKTPKSNGEIDSKAAPLWKHSLPGRVEEGVCGWKSGHKTRHSRGNLIRKVALQTQDRARNVKHSSPISGSNFWEVNSLGFTSVATPADPRGEKNTICAKFGR